MVRLSKIMFENNVFFHFHLCIKVSTTLWILLFYLHFQYFCFNPFPIKWFCNSGKIIIGIGFICSNWRKCNHVRKNQQTYRSFFGSVVIEKKSVFSSRTFYVRRSVQCDSQISVCIRYLKGYYYILEIFQIPVAA